MARAALIQQPLRVLVAPEAETATSLVVAAASVLAIERVAPFAVVEMDPDGTTAASAEALGVLGSNLGPAAERPGWGGAMELARSIIEDDAGRWFRSDDDGQRVGLEGHSGWALLDGVRRCQRFHPSSEAGVTLGAVLGLIADEPPVVALEAALDWARGAVDQELAATAAADPSRVRRWLTELHAAEVSARGAHDALRARYERDLGIVTEMGERGSDG